MISNCLSRHHLQESTYDESANPKTDLIRANRQPSDRRRNDFALVDGDAGELHPNVDVVEDPPDENLPFIAAHPGRD